MKKLCLCIFLLAFCCSAHAFTSIDGKWVVTKVFWDHVKDRKDATGVDWQYKVDEWFDEAKAIRTYRCEDAIIRVKDNEIISRTWRIRTNIKIKKMINQKKQSIKFNVVAEEHDDDWGTIRTTEINMEDLTSKVKFIWFDDTAYFHKMDLLTCDFLNRYVQSVMDGQPEYTRVKPSMMRFNVTE